MAGLQKDTLFLACTRPHMMAGLPMELTAGIMGLGTEAIVITHRVITVPLVTVAIYLICRLICAKDHNAFRLLYIWAITKGRLTLSLEFWGSYSTSPLPQSRPRKSKDIPFNV